MIHIAIPSGRPVEAQRPTGNPGTAPRGPAGPRPTGPAGPSGPPSYPPETPPAPPPASPKGEALDTIADLLRVVALIAADKLPGADPAGRMRLAEGLRTCWSAVADLQTPVRRDREAHARASVPTVATSGGPGRAGEPPLPGADFNLPRWPGTDALAASFARRAD